MYTLSILVSVKDLYALDHPLSCLLILMFVSLEQTKGRSNSTPFFLLLFVLLGC